MAGDFFGTAVLEGDLPVEAWIEGQDGVQIRNRFVDAKLASHRV